MRFRGERTTIPRRERDVDVRREVAGEPVVGGDDTGREAERAHDLGDVTLVPALSPARLRVDLDHDLETLGRGLEKRAKTLDDLELCALDVDLDHPQRPRLLPL